MGRDARDATDLRTERVETVETVDRNQWNHVVTQADHGTVFQRYEWLAAIETGTRLEPAHAVVYKKDNLVGIFPNFVTEIERTPFKRLTSIEPGFGGPLVTTDETASLELLFDAIDDIGDRTTITHLFQPIDPATVRYRPQFAANGYRPNVSNCRFVIDLRKGWETILAEMSSSRRRSIRNGGGEDAAVVDRDLTRETIDEFYLNYRSVMERLEERPYPLAFFVALLELRDRVKVFSLSVAGEERGMLLHLLDDERSSMHYFFSGVTESDFAYNASELLHEHAIKWGIDNGYETYDLGATSADSDDGLFKFKAKFGADVVPIVTWENGSSRVLWGLFRAGRRAYQRYDSGRTVTGVAGAIRDRGAVPFRE
jgi:predicted N-acyltransferase